MIIVSVMIASSWEDSPKKPKKPRIIIHDLEVAKV